MAEIVRYVDPDVVAGDGSGDSWTNAYASLNAWEAGEQTDLDTANNTHKVYCRSLSGSNDQLECVIGGWTTSVTDYITIVGNDFPADGIWDDAKYIIENNDDQTSAIYIQEDFVRIINLQILLTTTSGTRYTLLSNLLGAGAHLYIDSCIIRGVCSGTDTGYGIALFDADGTYDIYNCIVYGFKSSDNPADTGFKGVYFKGDANVYNCTISGNYYGIEEAGTGTYNVINCAVFNNDNDFTGTFDVIDYCATDEHAGGGTNGVDISGTWDTTCFTDPEASPPDFSVQDVDSPVYNIGNGATPKGTFTDDIIGTTRSPADLDWDIGAFELSVVVGAAGIMTTNSGYWGPTF